MIKFPQLVIQATHLCGLLMSLYPPTKF